MGGPPPLGISLPSIKLRLIDLPTGYMSLSGRISGRIFRRIFGRNQVWTESGSNMPCYRGTELPAARRASLPDYNKQHPTRPCCMRILAEPLKRLVADI